MCHKSVHVILDEGKAHIMHGGGELLILDEQNISTKPHPTACPDLIVMERSNLIHVHWLKPWFKGYWLKNMQRMGIFTDKYTLQEEWIAERDG